MSALPLIADITRRLADVGFGPKVDMTAGRADVRFNFKSGASKPYFNAFFNAASVFAKASAEASAL